MDDGGDDDVIEMVSWMRRRRGMNITVSFVVLDVRCETIFYLYSNVGFGQYFPSFHKRRHTQQGGREKKRWHFLYSNLYLFMRHSQI